MNCRIVCAYLEESTTPEDQIIITTEQTTAESSTKESTTLAETTTERGKSAFFFPGRCFFSFFSAYKSEHFYSTFTRCNVVGFGR